jgi:hypothetical protein
MDKPCPRCGRAAVIETSGDWSWIFCVLCGYSIPWSSEDSPMSDQSGQSRESAAPPSCLCCGETTPEFLVHLPTNVPPVPPRGGILCANCLKAITEQGSCPHAAGPGFDVMVSFTADYPGARRWRTLLGTTKVEAEVVAVRWRESPHCDGAYVVPMET